MEIPEKDRSIKMLNDSTISFDTVAQKKSSEYTVISKKTVFKNSRFQKIKTSKNILQGFNHLLILIVLITSCHHDEYSKGPKYKEVSPDQSTKQYNFAVHPLYNPAKLMQAYQPLIDYLNEKIKGSNFRLEASRDYANFEQKYADRKPEFLLANPLQTIHAMDKGYKVISMAGDPKDFKGIFIVRKDGGIRNPSDLIGKVISYPASTALAACIMPQYFLHTHGINVNTDIQNHYVGSQESSIMNVYLKMTAAGATWPPPWRAFQKDHPKEASELNVIWETKSLINNSVMVRDDIPADIQVQVQKRLTELNETEQGKAILAGMETSGFPLARNTDYDVVKTFMLRFEKEVRKVEIK